MELKSPCGGIPIADNFVEDDFIDGIDLLRWLVQDARRFTGDYDRTVDPFATTWDLEPIDDDPPPAA